MNILAEIYRAEGINVNGKTVSRTAVRAVIQREGKLLMVYSAHVGDYKFPGGGVSAAESNAQALSRELKEECGAELLRVEGELGAVIEYNFPLEKDFDVFKMTSHYYFCKIKAEFSEQSLDGYEKDLGFQPVWISVDETLAINKLLLASVDPPVWLKREIFMLEYLKQQNHSAAK